MEARIWEQFPVVLVTGSGMPDVATRAMLNHICASSQARMDQRRPAGRHDNGRAARAAVQAFHCMGLVDWNPAGCDILLNYKFGNRKGCRESQAYGLVVSPTRPPGLVPVLWFMWCRTPERSLSRCDCRGK